MDMQINPQMIMERLTQMQSQIDRLQEEFDDTILTKEEIQLIDESLINEKKGKLTSSNELRKELGI